LLHRRFFRNPFTYDARSGDDLTEREMDRELRKAGPLDQTLVDAGLAPPSGDILNFSSEVVWGSPGPSQLLKSLDELISQFASDKGRGTFEDLLQSLQPYITVAGLFGNPDEIERSGLEVLAAINAGDLIKGRRLYQFALAMADFGARGGEFLPSTVLSGLGEALSKIARTLRDSDEWCVAGLAACSIAVHRVGDAASSKPKPTSR
jgi:hypothetical protein